MIDGMSNSFPSHPDYWGLHSIKSHHQQSHGFQTLGQDLLECSRCEMVDNMVLLQRNRSKEITGLTSKIVARLHRWTDLWRRHYRC